MEKHLIGLAGDLFDQVPQQNIARIAVVPFLAWLKVQRFVLEARDRLLWSGRDGLEGLVVGKVREIRDASRMRQDVMDRDLMPGIWTFREMGTDPILHIQLALRLQDQDRRGCKLLGDRAKTILCLRGIGRLIVSIRPAISLAEQDFIVSGHQHCTGKCFIFRVRGQEFVNL